MRFETIAEVLADRKSTLVYEEGWQSWSPAGVHRASESSPRPPDPLRHTMGWRPGKELLPSGFQGEGILALAPTEGPVRVWFSPEPAREVASIRLDPRDDRLLVSVDGPIAELTIEGTLDEALAVLGDRLGTGDVRSIPAGWCSWSFYFRGITESGVIENLEAAERYSLPVEIVQVDDGYEAVIGDWFEVDSGYGSLRDTAARILEAGKSAGVWTAPFLVGERSALAAAHPEWLVEGANAGWNWGQRLRILDVTQAAAAAHLETVYRTLAEWGFSYHKLDFLYAGAIEGRRRGDCTSLEAYRQGLDLVRRGAGPEAILLGCGAPILPSIGLVDAMRVGPDVLPESRAGPTDASTQSMGNAVRVTRARAWMHARLWASDPDCVVVRPEIGERETWASHVAAYGGVAFSSDRLATLDERGLELTRLALRSSSTSPIGPETFGAIR